MTGVFSSLSFAAAYRSILLTDGGARIFQEFGFTPGQRYISPFRNDATKKNFSVFTSPKGEVCFKDFVSGDGGTFTALLSHFGYKSFEAQIRFAAGVYGIPLRNDSVSPRSTKTPNTPKQKTLKTQHSKLNTSSKFYRVTALELTEFTPIELQRLAEISAGLITADLLKQFGIRALRSYTDEGRTDKGFSYGGTHEAAYTLVVPSADGNYYAYCYYQSEKHSPFPNQAKNFHLKLSEYTTDVKFALGFHELRPNEPAYLVEGIKDCLILLAKGYNAFTLGGVQHRLHQSVVGRLQANNNSLAILFDTDFAGISAAKRLQTSLNTQHSSFNTQHCICTLPRLERQETKDAPKPLNNDLADYVCSFGFDDELRTVLARPHLVLSRSITRAGVNLKALNLTIQRSLAEKPEHIAMLKAALEQNPRLALYAPTGCGKTFALLRHIAPKRTGQTIFAVPTVALAEQIDREYGQALKNTCGNTAGGNDSEGACKLVCITGKDNPLTLMEARTSAKIIVCTYNSLPKVLYGKNNHGTGKYQQSSPSLLDDENTLLVIDEAHKLHEEESFRRDAIKAVFQAMNHAKRVLLMSATPSLLWGCDRTNPYTYLAVQCRERNAVHCTPLSYSDNPIHAVVNLIRQKQAAMPGTTVQRGVIVVRINSNKRLRAVQAALAALGVTAENIDRITAKSRDTSPAYKSIMETGFITTDVVLTTSALDCGVNILNTNIAAAIMLDETNPNAIEQFANRFRRMAEVPLFLLQPAQKQPQNADSAMPAQYSYNPAEYFERHLLNAEMQAQIYSHSTARTHTAKVGISSRSAFKELNNHIMVVSGQYYPHIPALIAETEELTVRTGRSTHKELLWAGMVIQTPQTVEEYCTQFSPHLNPLPEGEEAGKEEEKRKKESPQEKLITEACEQQRAIADEQERVFLTMLAETPALCLETLAHTSFDTVLKQRIGKLFTFGRVQSNESKELAAKYAALWQTTLPEKVAKRYCELRTLHFDHTAAAHLVERLKDDRRWKTFLDNLAMHQRLALDAMNYAPHLLSATDREKLKREKEIRAMVVASAEHGCMVEGKTTRHEKNALHTKAAITERVNAFRNPENRLTKQQAGAMVNALFFCTYKRERNAETAAFRGYYTFETESSCSNSIRRKTLAEFVEEMGVNGRDYAERWTNAMHRAVEQEEWERCRKNTQKAAQVSSEDICAGTPI